MEADSEPSAWRGGGNVEVEFDALLRDFAKPSPFSAHIANVSRESFYSVLGTRNAPLDVNLASVFAIQPLLAHSASLLHNPQDDRSTSPEKRAVADFDYDVFLSYNSKDHQRAESLERSLTREGLKVWFSGKDVSVGNPIYPAVERALQCSRALVQCISESSIRAPWVDFERAAFLHDDPTNSKGRFIPVRIDDCDLPATMRVYLVVNYQNETREGLAQIIDACRRAGGPVRPPLTVAPRDKTKTPQHQELAAAASDTEDVLNRRDALDALERVTSYAAVSSESHRSNRVAGALPKRSATGRWFVWVIAAIVAVIITSFAVYGVPKHVRELLGIERTQSLSQLQADARTQMKSIIADSFFADRGFEAFMSGALVEIVQLCSLMRDENLARGTDKAKFATLGTHIQMSKESLARKRQRLPEIRRFAGRLATEIQTLKSIKRHPQFVSNQTSCLDSCIRQMEGFEGMIELTADWIEQPRDAMYEVTPLRITNLTNQARPSGGKPELANLPNDVDDCLRTIF